MKKLITKKDFILLLIVLAVGFAGVVFMNSQENGKTAIVKVDGEVVQEILLQGEKLETKIGNVLICRENGEIYVKDSDCADKVCVRSGKISKTGESIICAPNRVSIHIDGKSDDLPDVITG